MRDFDGFSHLTQALIGNGAFFEWVSGGDTVVFVLVVSFGKTCAKEQAGEKSEGKFHDEYIGLLDCVCDRLIGGGQSCNSAEMATPQEFFKRSCRLAGECLPQCLTCPVDAHFDGFGRAAENGRDFGVAHVFDGKKQQRFA